VTKSALITFEGVKKITRGGEWEALKNFSMELALCPKIDPTHLSSNLT
jgi:hypothetical protein